MDGAGALEGCANCCVMGYSLAAVNFFLGLVGMVQVGRILAHQRAVKNGSVPATVEEVKEQAVEAKNEVKEKVKAAVSA